MNLTTQMVNGVSVDKLITTTTNQNFDDFYAKTLHIENLYTETINGIPVEEIARKSRKNIIKGNSLINSICIIVTFICNNFNNS